MNEAEEQLMGLLEDAFRDGVTNGELRPIDASLAAHLYVAILSAGERQLDKAGEERIRTEGKAGSRGEQERHADAPGDAPREIENRDPALLAGKLVDLFWNGITSNS